MATAKSPYRYFFGDNSKNLCRYGNVGDQQVKKQDAKRKWSITDCNDGYGIGTAPVGSYAANPFKLYDVHGNLSEWVEDCWYDKYEGAPTSGWPAWLNSNRGNCKRRVLRGGSWYSGPEGLRARNRHRNNRDFRNYVRGFRVARALTSR